MVIISLIICLVAVGWSLVLLYRVRDWRIALLTVMLALMALRRALAMLQETPVETATVTDWVALWAELGASAMALLVVVLLGKTSAGPERTEDALRESEERFRQIAENVREVFWIASPDYRKMIYISPAYEEIWGCKCESLYENPKSWMDAIHSDARERVAAALERDEDATFDQEYRIVRPDGSIRWIRDRAFPIRDESGQIIRKAGIAEDITERKRAEEVLQAAHHELEARVAQRTAELSERNRRLQQEIAERRHAEEINDAILRTSVTGFWIIDMKGRILEVNDAFCQLVGYTRDELLSMSVSDLEDIESSEDTDQHIQNIVATKFDRFDTRHRRKDGTLVDVEVSTNYLELHGGRIFAFFLDITQRKRAEEVLRESQRTLATLMSNLPGMAYRCANDRDWSMEFVSEGGLALTGYLPSDLTGGKVAYTQLIHADDRDAVWDDVQAALKERSPFQLNYRIRTAKGEEKWVWEQGCGVFSDEGELLALEGFITDITERKRVEEEWTQLEEQLRHSQKMEAAGTMAAGVAHDFNNLMMAIVGYVDLARSCAPEDREVTKALDGILQAARQVTGITKSLLTFSRKATLERVPVDFGRVVSESVEMLRHMLPAKIEVVTDICVSDDLWIEADATQIQQVLMNLAINARDAMPDGGQLRIVVTPKSAEAASLFPAVPTFGDGTAVLVVEDNGIGIPEKIRARIFEPFFTTKTRDRGTGLGMAVVHGIVTQHHGYIDVESREGHGTRVTLAFPCCAFPEPCGLSPRERSRRLKPAAQRGMGQTIILAEDDQAVGAIILTALRGAGYKVVQASDGVEAMRAFGVHQADVRLVVLDVDLPKKSGLACLQEIRQRRRDVPVIVLSASPTFVLDSRYAEQATLLLRKPFQLPDLAALIDRALADPRESGT